MPLGGAIGAERALHNGWRSYGIAMVVGLVIGAFGCWTFQLSTEWLVPRSRVRSYTGWKVGLIYFVYYGGMAWSIVLSLLSGWLTHSVLIFR